MIVSWYGVLGDRSSDQSKYGLTTTDLGTCAAESLLLVDLGLLHRYEKQASSQSTLPSTALAYGSSSSLAGLQRWPFLGSYGPCTR